MLALVYSMKKWFRQCTAENMASSEHRYTFEDENEPVNRDEESTVIYRMSIEYKYQNYLWSKPEKQNKIISFSVFKLVCVPLVVFGQEFYYRNFGAFNYYAFG